MPEELAHFRIADWEDAEAAEPPAPAGWESREDRVLWHGIRAFRRYTKAKVAWLQEHNGRAGIVDAFVDLANYQRAHIATSVVDGDHDRRNRSN